MHVIDLLLACIKCQKCPWFIPFWWEIPKVEFFLGSTAFAMSHCQALASSLVLEAWEVWQPYTVVKVWVMAALSEELWDWVPLAGWHWCYRESWRFHSALQGLFCNPGVLTFSKTHLNVSGWVTAVSIIVTEFTYTVGAPKALYYNYYFAALLWDKSGIKGTKLFRSLWFMTWLWGCRGPQWC